MKRGGRSHTYIDANVWPAVTDTMLLMASIFIVLSVVSVAALRQQLDDQAGAGAESGKLLVGKIYTVEEEVLFSSGKSSLRDPVRAKAVLSEKILNDIPGQLADLRRYARTQKSWNDRYYVVLEVAGHADCDPWIQNGHDRNWDLSSQRANTVVQTMNEILAKDRTLRHEIGIIEDANSVASLTSTVLRVAGYGSHLPYKLYSQKPTAEQKTWNRRVEVRLFAQPDHLVQYRKEDSRERGR